MLSYTFRRAVDISVIVPGITSSDVDKPNASHKPPEKYPVLYLLHGYLNDYSTWLRYTSLERYAEERNIAIVTFSAENGYYLNMEEMQSNVGSMSRLMHPNYVQFLTKELPEFVTAMFPITTDPKHTYIAGLSMGGFGAMCHGLRNPQNYRAIGTLSPLTTLHEKPYDSFDELEEIIKPYEPLLLVTDLLKKGADVPYFYYAYGGKDFLLETLDWFEQRLKALNFKHEFIYSAEHGHEWSFWDEQIKAFLDAMPRDDYYYKRQAIRNI